MIPLLTRIDNALAQCTDPAKRAELQAEQAVYLARIGDFDRANQVLSALRQDYGNGRSARISIWIMLIEGLIAFFDDTNPAARDRILRAHMISNAAHFHDLTNLTAAWLAHIEFNRCDFESMFRFLSICHDRSPASADSSNLRVCLLLADACMHCGQIKDARIWYERSRQQAIDLGDEASLAAAIYNKAALGLSQLRLAAVAGELDSDLIHFVSMEIASAHNFHHGAGHRSLTHLVDACRARMLLLRKNYGEALGIFQILLKDGAPLLGFKSDRLLLQIEYGLCLIGVGLRDDASALFATIDPECRIEMTMDDQLIFIASYIALAKALQPSADEQINVTQLHECASLHRLEIEMLRRGLRLLEAI